MDRWPLLANELKILLGSEYVYFQPPENVKMNYPAIVFSLSKIDNAFADNKVYKQDIAYNVIVIDKNTNSDIAKKVSQLPSCRFDKSYKSDNLNHYSFTLYY